MLIIQFSVIQPTSQGRNGGKWPETNRMVLAAPGTADQAHIKPQSFVISDIQRVESFKSCIVSFKPLAVRS